MRPANHNEMRHSSSLQSTDRATDSSSQSQLMGLLLEKDMSGEVVNNEGTRLFADQELVIGRDGNRCQYVLNDPVVSNKHLRVYSVVYDGDKPNDVSPLVYAEDLSRNGTFWNGSLIGKGNGGFLLSDKDTLRVSPRTVFVYRMVLPHERDESFDLVQEYEMKRFHKEYIVTDRVLGAGAYGRVYMAIEQSRRTQLTCKVVDLRKLQPPSRMRFGRREQAAAAEDVDSRLQLVKIKSWGQKRKRDNRVEEKLKTCYREAEILASLSHPNIIGLEKVYLTDNSIYIFQDLVTAGDLFSYIELKNGKLLEVEAAVIVRQILVALQFLHMKNIVHRDVKPENVLMTTLASGCRVVLTDFGCARRLDHQRTRMLTCMGTFEYIAPEVPHDQNSKANASGYTRSVDLWSLGCVTVVLLTGGYPFFEPGSSEYSESLARTCNLEGLENSEVWQDIGDRPKAFVKRLLILDEQVRMTATESLTHEWFTNDIHRTDFEELYQRAVRHWRPRMPKEPIIELINAENLKSLPFLQGTSPDNPKGRRKGPVPVDPPYKPFPRRLHNQAFFPKRRTSPFNNTMSDDVKAAIENHWNFDKTPATGSSEVEDDLPKPCASEVGKQSGGSSNNELQNRSPIHSPTSLHTLSTKPRYRPLQPKSWSTCTDTMEPSNKRGNISKGGENESSSTESDETDGAPVQENNSPIGQEERVEAIDFAPTGKAKLRLPNRPRTPRLIESSTDLSLSPLGNASVLHSNRYFNRREALRPLDQPAVPVDNETCSSDQHSLCHSNATAKTNQLRRADPLIDSLSEAFHHATVPNSEPGVSVELTYSPTGALRAVCDKEDVPADVVRPVTAIKRPGPRLKYPTHAIGGVLAIRSPNIKKRRRSSIFDFEVDDIDNDLGRSKKARFGQDNVRRNGISTSTNAAFPQTMTRSERAGPTPVEVEKTFGQTNHAGDLYLPRI